MYALLPSKPMFYVMILMVLVSTSLFLYYRGTIANRPSMGRDSLYQFTLSRIHLISLRKVRLHHNSNGSPWLKFLTAVLPEPLDLYLGYPCGWSPPNNSYRSLYSVAVYLSTARSLSECNLRARQRKREVSNSPCCSRGGAWIGNIS